MHTDRPMYECISFYPGLIVGPAEPISIDFLLEDQDLLRNKLQLTAQNDRPKHPTT